MVKFNSTYLLPCFSFTSGVASSFDMSGNFYDFNYSETDSEADLLSQISDWQAVKEDFESAISEFKKEIEDHEFR